MKTDISPTFARGTEPRLALTRVFTASTELPLPRAQVFAFFSDPRNLERLTPAWLGFSILTPEPLPVGEGARYDYRLNLHGLSLHWRTLITAWEEGRRFEDLQIKGPYALWHHVHTFEDTPEGGTRMTDEVRYRLPFGWLGALALPFVKRDVARIFAHRREALRAAFISPIQSAHPDVVLSEPPTRHG